MRTGICKVMEDLTNQACRLQGLGHHSLTDDPCYVLRACIYIHVVIRPH